MHVVIPTSGDPGNPRPSGILSYSLGLGGFLAQRGTSVEFLSAGTAWSEGAMSATPIIPRAAGEISFARALSRHVRRHSFPCDTVVVANSELYAWAFRRARSPVPLVLIAHGPTLPGLAVRRPVISLAFRRFIEPRALRRSTAVIAIDSEALDYFSKEYPSARIHRLPLAVDTNHFRPVPRESAKAKWEVSGRPTLLFVGRLVTEKDPALAADVFGHVLEMLPNAVLLVAGSGPLSQPFDRAREALGPERVRLLGFVARTDLPSLYSAADALILTSTTEQMPTVSIESLACGTPVFSTPVGDTTSLLVDPLLGAVCERSAGSFVRAIAARIPEAEADWARLAGLRRAAVERYSWDAVGPKILGVLNACL